MADGESFDLPIDILVDILVRLPTSARRRFRLVCKRWRDAIDERTAERQVRTKILAFKSNRLSSRALVFDDDEEGRLRHEWIYSSASSLSDKVDMVGTCNGLICLHDSGQGEHTGITVANPITGEALVLPPIPRFQDLNRRLGIYGFGYHPTTGQYKVVHVPSRISWRPDTVHVLTLDGSSSAWREVVSTFKHVGYYSHYGGGGVCVDGSAYWFDSFGDRIMALDLKDERLTSFPGPPGVRCMDMGMVVHDATWKLTSVNARLGVVFSSYKSAATRVDVWVLDGDAVEQPRWSRMYTLVVDRNVMNRSIVMTPHLTHGECILSMSWDGKRLYRCKVDDCSDVDDGVTKQLLLSEGTELIMSEKTDSIRTFAYAETREPLPRVWESRRQRRRKKSGKFQSIGFNRIK
ncbi:hypothetical protein HU200_061671 [Digitaria exilis]|uniref:F-box domain-containing protein n=1 Tax=Digitaria exilis TaxID=1010633 RepID=A0A835A729_9POAL|nr:hypothetical protein HU200_061671 [Digitaria exilis]